MYDQHDGDGYGYHRGSNSDIFFYWKMIAFIIIVTPIVLTYRACKKINAYREDQHFEQVENILQSELIAVSIEEVGDISSKYYAPTTPPKRQDLIHRFKDTRLYSEDWLVDTAGIKSYPGLPRPKYLRERTPSTGSLADTQYTPIYEYFRGDKALEQTNQWLHDNKYVSKDFHYDPTVGLRAFLDKDHDNRETEFIGRGIAPFRNVPNPQGGPIMTSEIRVKCWYRYNGIVYCHCSGNQATLYDPTRYWNMEEFNMPNFLEPND